MTVTVFIYNIFYAWPKALSLKLISSTVHTGKGEKMFSNENREVVKGWSTNTIELDDAIEGKQVW